MGEYGPVQNSFTGGELSPRLHHRVDLQKYQHGLALCKNFRIIPHGGLTRRPGMRYIASVKTPSDGPVHLVAFSFSDTQEYVIEFGNLYARFYTLNGQLLDPVNPVEVVTPYAIADVFGLVTTQKADTMYIFHKNYAVRKLTRTSATAFSLSQVDFLDGPYYPIGFSTLLPTQTGITITPSATTGSITLTASAAIFNANHVGGFWRIKDSTVWGWVKITAFTDTTHVTAAVQAAVNLGAAGALDGTAATTAWREGMISTQNGFPRCGVFHQQRMWCGGMSVTPTSLVGSQTGDFENFADSKSDGTVLDTSGINYNIATDRMNVIRWLKPARNLMVGTAGSEHEVVGGSSSTPAITPTSALVRSQSTYGSIPNDVPVRAGTTIIFVEKNGRKIRELAYNFNEDNYNAPDISILSEHLFPAGTSIVDNAFQQSPDPTLWFVRSDGVLLGAAYDRHQDVVAWFQVVTGAGPDSVESVATINHPSADRMQAWVAVKRTINGVVTRSIEFLDDKSNPYHTMTVPTVPVYEALNTDAAITYDGVQSTTLTLNMASGDNITATAGTPVFLSAHVGGIIRVNDSGVQANNGIAKIKTFLDTTHVILDNTVSFTGQAFGSLSYATGRWGIGAVTFSGLTYLNGMTVDIVGDGSVYPPQVVSGGQITITPGAVAVEVGLHYDSEADTLFPEVKTQRGTSQGLRKKWSVMIVGLLKTLGLQLGMLRDPSDPVQVIDTVPFRQMSATSSPATNPPLLFTGYILRTSLGIDRGAQMVIKQPQPLPCTITQITGNLEVADAP